MTRRGILVVGSDSMIGGAVMAHLEHALEPVVGTYFLPEGSGKNRTYLDLSRDLSGWRPDRPVQVAYLCSGVTKLEDCRRDPAGSARINVIGTVAVAKALIEQGAFVVFLSSNRVFDGSRPHVEPDSAHCPITEYGRQKAETERILSQWEESVAIVRLTKVLGSNTLFSKWSRSLRAGEIIRPFSDMVLAPVPLATVVSALRLIGDLRRGGVRQVSAERDVSYAEAARWGAEILGVDTNLVQPWSVAEAGLDLEANPEHTTLNVDRLREEFGLVPPSIRHTIERAFGGQG
ncbi:MAG TPA: sugar nucleotide-binding protein [bacterium]|nr:sugar nucleotide-binding protein [bacterium]